MLPLKSCIGSYPEPARVVGSPPGTLTTLRSVKKRENEFHNFGARACEKRRHGRRERKNPIQPHFFGKNDRYRLTGL